MTGGITVDGEVGRPFVSQTTTTAVADLLSKAAPVPGTDHATVISADDGYRASIPLDDLTRGQLDDGRLTIPGGRTLCWNVKNVVRIEVTTGPRPDSVPENPPH